MNEADYQKLQETGWKRPLSPEEEARLRAWLDQHPEARMDWEAELELTRMLHQLPDAPLSSNFTAQVMRAVERESAAPQARAMRWQLRPAWFRSWASGAAIGTLVAVFAATSFWSHHLQRKAKELSQVANAAPGMEIVGTMSVLPLGAYEDFEAIRHLTYVPSQEVSADLELLAALQ